MSERKQRRRAYLNDFQRDADGTYRYNGVYYRFCGTDAERKRQNRTLWLIAAAAAAVFLAGALLMPADGIGRSLYILVPLAAELGSLGATVYALLRLASADYPVRAYIYERTVPKLPNRSMATAICAVIGALSTLVFLLASGEGALWRTAVYGGTKLLQCALSLYLFRFAKRGVTRWKGQTESGISEGTANAR